MLPHQTRSAGCESGERQHSCLAGEGYREQRLPSPGMPFVTWPHRRQSIGHGHTRCHQGPAAVTATDNARLGPEPSQKPRVQHSGASRIPGHLLWLISPPCHGKLPEAPAQLCSLETSLGMWLGGDGKDVTHEMWGFPLPSLNNLQQPHLTPVPVLIDFSSPFFVW